MAVFTSVQFERASDTSSANILSGAVAVLIGAVLALYWPAYAFSPDLAAPILRPAMVGPSLLLLFLWHRLPMTRAELSFAALMTLQCVVLLVPTLSATDPARAFSDWVKHTLICLSAFCVARALRDEVTSKWFGVLLLIASVIIALLIVATYLRYMGPVLPTYKLARGFKGVAAKNGIPLNTIPFASCLAFLSGCCLVKTPRWFCYPVGFSIFIVSVALTGSRTPVVVVALSGGTVMFFAWLRSRNMLLRFVAYTTCAAVPVLLIVVFANVTFRDLSKASEGRWDLWWVAYEKFTESPLVGNGYESWRDDLISRLPGEYSLTASIEKNIAGGYHNEYLTLLAEQGLIGFAVTMAIFAFLLRLAYRLRYGACLLWAHGSLALFTALFILIRAGLEVPGLFGYDQEPADFLAFFFFSLVVSRMSREESLNSSMEPSLASVQVPTRLSGEVWS